MKIWALKPRDGLPEEDNPWEPWYDKVFGFVVRAGSEGEARRLANEQGGNENRHKVNPWLDPKFSTCEELPVDGKPGIILREFASA
jgi:hypothetical protein